MRHIKKALSYSVAGSLGLTVIASLQGCSDQGPTAPSLGGFDSGQADPTQDYFLVIEQTGSAPDSYRVAERHSTTGPTRAILRMTDGQERFLSTAELEQIAAQEAVKVEDGSSRLTEDPSMHSGGLSLGETLLAAAAGSLIGAALANRLASNSNFQRTQQSYGGGRPTASISQPARQQTAARSAPRSGFFGGPGGKSSSKGYYGSFGG